MPGQSKPTSSLVLEKVAWYKYDIFYFQRPVSVGAMNSYWNLLVILLNKFGLLIDLSVLQYTITFFLVEFSFIL